MVTTLAQSADHQSLIQPVILGLHFIILHKGQTSGHNIFVLALATHLI